MIVLFVHFAPMDFICRIIFYFRLQNPGGGNYPHYPPRKTALVPLHEKHINRGDTF